MRPASPLRRRSLRPLVVAAAALYVNCTAVSATENANSKLCPTVTCLSEGSTTCDRTTATCPPCLYAITGGYSCYSRVNGACPFDNALVDCNISTATSNTASVNSVDGTVSSSATTAASNSSATTRVTSSASTGSTSSGTRSATTASSSTSASAPTAATYTTTKADDNDIESSGSSDEERTPPMYLNVIIISLCSLVTIATMIFICRRIQKRRRKDSPSSDTIARNKSYRHHNGSRASARQNRVDTAHSLSGTESPRYPMDQNPSLLSMASVNSSTVEFTPSGQFEHYDDSHQDRSSRYSTYNPTFGHGRMPDSIVEEDNEYHNSEVFGKARRLLQQQQQQQLQQQQLHQPQSPVYTNMHHDHDDMPIVEAPVTPGNNISNVRSSRGGSGGSGGRGGSGGSSGSAGGYQPQYTYNKPQHDLRVSTASSEALSVFGDEYDIIDSSFVDSGRRNTETLVQEGHFRYFSTVSFSESEADFIHGADDEDDEVIYDKEHEL